MFDHSQVSDSEAYDHAHSSLAPPGQINAQPGQSADNDFMPKARPKEPIISN